MNSMGSEMREELNFSDMVVDPVLQNKINYFYSSYNPSVVFGKHMTFPNPLNAAENEEDANSEKGNLLIQRRN
jgi:hypothetical protein